MKKTCAGAFALLMILAAFGVLQLAGPKPLAKPLQVRKTTAYSAPLAHGPKARRTMPSAPSAPPYAPTYTGVAAGSVTLNNVPALSAGTTATGLELIWNGAWNLGTAAATHAGHPEYYCAAVGQSSSVFPTAGWANVQGALPVPSFAQSGGTTGGLPNVITTSGAGTAADDLVFYLQPGSDADGNTPYYSDAGTHDAATSLNIQRALDSGFTSGLTTFSGVTPSTNYTDSTVSPSTTYYYRYVEVNSTGSTPGPASSVTTAAAPTGHPSSAAKQNLTGTFAVKRVRATVVSSFAPSVTLSHSANFTTRTSITLPSPTVAGSDYHYDTGVLGSAVTDKYFHFVTSDGTITDFRLYDASGAELGGPTAPGAPPRLNLTPGNANIVLAWDAGSDAATYNVYRGTTTGGEASAPLASSIGALTYTDNAVTNGVTYYYYVKGVNTAGTGPASPEASATPTAPDTTPPATPTGLHGIGAHNQITWSWNANTEGDLAGYKLNLGGTITDAGNVTSYVQTGLTDTTVYTARVAAYDTSGNISAYSPLVSVAAGVSTTPPTVSIVSPSTGTTAGGTVPFRAQADGGVGGVQRVELYVASGLVDTRIGVSAAPDFYDLLWDTTPSANGTYSVFARAWDNAATPNHTDSAAITLTTDNPPRLGTEYLFREPWTPRAGANVDYALITAVVEKATDSRRKRLITAAYNVPGTSTTWADYTTVPLDHQFEFPANSGDTFAYAFRLSALYALTPYTFTPNVVGLRPYGTDGGHIIVWTDEKKLYLFDGAAAPTLLLDMNPLLLSGESVNDVCWFNGRVYLALSGGAAPRLYAFDTAAGDEAYTLGTFFASAPNGMATDAAASALYVGFQDGSIHAIDLTGSIKRLTPTPLPHPVVGMIGGAFSPTNAAPGVAAATSDGSLWDVDATNVTYGANGVFSPPDGTTARVYCGAAQTDEGAPTVSRYIGTGAGGNIFRLRNGASSYALDFTSGFAFKVMAAFAGSVYAGGSDTRLWGRILDAGAHTLAYGAVTDPLAGVTAITGLQVITASDGSQMLIVGSTGTGNNLTQFLAPTADLNSVYGQAIKEPGCMVTQFA